MTDITRKQQDILLFIDTFKTEWVMLIAALEAGIVVTEADRDEMNWLIRERYLRLYDDSRPDFAVGLTKAGRAALSRYRADALDSTEVKP